MGAGRGPRERVRVEGVGVVVARLAERDDGADIVVVARANHPVEVGRAFGGSETAGRRGGRPPRQRRARARVRDVEHLADERGRALEGDRHRVDGTGWFARATGSGRRRRGIRRRRSPGDERRAPRPNRTIATRPGRGKRDAHARGGGEDPRASRARARVCAMGPGTRARDDDAATALGAKLAQWRSSARIGGRCCFHRRDDAHSCGRVRRS